MSIPVGLDQISTLTPIISQLKTKLHRKLLHAHDKFFMGQAASRQHSQAAAKAPSTISNKLALGAGCYWGVEKYVRKDFQERFPGAIRKATVGFMSPHEGNAIESPSYEQICGGLGTHIEVLYIELNEPEKHFEELLRFFFQFHDPTTPNRQGNDRGFQYASWIFTDGPEQAAIAHRVVDEVQALVQTKAIRGVYAQANVTTKVTPLRRFTKASAAHQEYLAKNPMGYCNHRIRFKQWPMVRVQENAKEPAPRK